jgi:nucleotide-binding universal stress UspA family protein
MFFEKILIAIDDSVPSQYAIDVGLAIAREDRSPVTFAVALDPSLLGRDYAFASVCELAEQIAAEIVARAMKRANDLGIAASSEVLFRDATHGIIDLAKAQRVGLIVMGTHARTGLMRALSRSIAEEVLRRTTTPLCVIRRPAIGKIYHRILVPIVDDDLSAMAARYATEVARAFGSRLVFCTVEDGPGASNAKALLDLATQQACEAGVESQGVVLPGDNRIARSILKQVRAEQCDAIIMASHGRDGLLRLVEGSVAETVIRSSETPVIVLRAEANVERQPLSA